MPVPVEYIFSNFHNSPPEDTDFFKENYTNIFLFVLNYILFILVQRFKIPMVCIALPGGLVVAVIKAVRRMIAGRRIRLTKSL